MYIIWVSTASLCKVTECLISKSNCITMEIQILVNYIFIVDYFFRISHSMGSNFDEKWGDIVKTRM